MGRWNIGRIARPTGPDTTTSRFDWAMMLQSLELRNGTVFIVDSTTLADPETPGRLRGVDRL